MPTAPGVENVSKYSITPLPEQNLDISSSGYRLEQLLRDLKISTKNEWWEVAFCPQWRRYFYYQPAWGDSRPWRQWDCPHNAHHIYKVQVIIRATNDDGRTG